MKKACTKMEEVQLDGLKKKALVSKALYFMENRSAQEFRLKLHRIKIMQESF